MSAEKTKQHFAEICECLWDKAQYQEKLDKEVVSAMRKFIANFTMIAWNACIMQKTYSDVKKFLKKLGLHGNLWVNQREIHQNPSSVKRQSGITAPVGRFYSVCRLTAART